MLMADLAVLPAVLNHAHCQPVGRLAKVDEHCSGTIRARFLASEARPPLTASGSSWRTARHVWMAPAWQEISSRAAQKSLAVMCPACSRSPDGPLALMESANRGLITRAGSMSQ